VPPDEGVRLHDGQDAPPLDEPSEHDERDPRGVVRAAWFLLPLPVQGQLLAQEEVLGSQATVGLHTE